VFPDEKSNAKSSSVLSSVIVPAVCKAKHLATSALSFLLRSCSTSWCAWPAAAWPGPSACITAQETTPEADPDQTGFSGPLSRVDAWPCILRVAAHRESSAEWRVVADGGSFVGDWAISVVRSSWPITLRPRVRMCFSSKPRCHVVRLVWGSRRRERQNIVAWELTFKSMQVAGKLRAHFVQAWLSSSATRSCSSVGWTNCCDFLKCISVGLLPCRGNTGTFTAAWSWSLFQCFASIFEAILSTFPELVLYFSTIEYSWGGHATRAWVADWDGSKGGDWNDRPPHTYESNFIYNVFSRFAKAILSPITLSSQCCEIYFISLTVAKSLWDIPSKCYWNCPLNLLAGSALGCRLIDCETCQLRVPLFRLQISWCIQITRYLSIKRNLLISSCLELPTVAWKGQ